MAVQWSTALRNALLDQWEAAIGPAAIVRFYSGSMPADCATAASGTKLAEWTLASDWSAAASGGSKSMTGTPSTSGLTSGNAGYYRIYASDGTTCHEQGTVTATGDGGDMTVDNVSIAVGQAVTITSFSKIAPGA